MKHSLEICLERSPLILTEGGVGQRLEHEYGLRPDPDIMYASMIYDAAGRNALRAIYGSYLRIAEEMGLPILLMTNTRRANRDRVSRSRYADRVVMADYARFLREVMAGYRCETYIGGMMGCRGDAYRGDEGMSTDEAVKFHAWQMGRFDVDALDFLFAGIMPSLPEAVGMARVMAGSGLPYIISLMIGVDGALLDGHSIHEAIVEIDGGAGRAPVGYMTNCVHPSVLREALGRACNRTELVRERFMGIQANAVQMALDVLDGSGVLRTGEPEAWAEAFGELWGEYPMVVCGGCCGTDERHIAAMAKTLLKRAKA